MDDWVREMHVFPVTINLEEYDCVSIVTVLTSLWKNLSEDRTIM